VGSETQTPEDFFENLLRENNPLLFRKSSQESPLEKRNITSLDLESQILHTLTGQIYTEIIDDVIFGLLLQIHRAAKLGYLFILDPDVGPEFDKQYEFYDENDVLGVFSNLNETNNKTTGNGGRNGHGPSSINNHLLKYECVCPNCGRSLAAIRFAPHLEKCMGMGRNSSRIATRRIANYNGDELDQLIEATGLISNRYVENTKTLSLPNASSSAPPPTNTTRSDDLMSIINAVATATTLPQSTRTTNEVSNNSFVDNNEFSSCSSSSSYAATNVANLKPPSAKKKRVQNAKSSSSISSSSSKTISQVQENSVNLLQNSQSTSNY
jgi:hypothetical protein